MKSSFLATVLGLILAGATLDTGCVGGAGGGGAGGGFAGGPAGGPAGGGVPGAPGAPDSTDSDANLDIEGQVFPQLPQVTGYAFQRSPTDPAQAGVATTDPQSTSVLQAQNPSSVNPVAAVNAIPTGATLTGTPGTPAAPTSTVAASDGTVAAPTSTAGAANANIISTPLQVQILGPDNQAIATLTANVPNLQGDPTLAHGFQLTLDQAQLQNVPADGVLNVVAQSTDGRQRSIGQIPLTGSGLGNPNANPASPGTTAAGSTPTPSAGSPTSGTPGGGSTASVSSSSGTFEPNPNVESPEAAREQVTAAERSLTDTGSRQKETLTPLETAVKTAQSEFKTKLGEVDGLTRALETAETAVKSAEDALAAAKKALDALAADDENGRRAAQSTVEQKQQELDTKKQERDSKNQELTQAESVRTEAKTKLDQAHKDYIKGLEQAKTAELAGVGPYEQSLKIEIQVRIDAENKKRDEDVAKLNAEPLTATEPAAQEAERKRRSDQEAEIKKRAEDAIAKIREGESRITDQVAKKRQAIEDNYRGLIDRAREAETKDQQAD